jgi:hypothetical protein
MHHLHLHHCSSTFAGVVTIALVLIGAKLAPAETELVTRGIVATAPVEGRSVKVDGGSMVPYRTSKRFQEPMSASKWFPCQAASF